MEKTVLKYILIGDSGCGKSCLMIRYTQDRFDAAQCVTIGVDYGRREVTVDAKKYVIQLWDTAGQENYRSLTQSYYREAIGCVLMYDATRRESFQSLDRWIRDIRNHADPGMQIIIVAGKIDDLGRCVGSDEGLMYAEQLGLPFFEVSSKNKINVDELFEFLTRRLVAMGKVGSVKRTLTVIESKSCC